MDLEHGKCWDTSKVCSFPLELNRHWLFEVVDLLLWHNT